MRDQRPGAHPGADQLHRVARFRHDPALPIPPLPTIALAAELERQAPDKACFAKVQLTRGQNRLVAALREAERLIAATG